MIDDLSEWEIFPASAIVWWDKARGFAVLDEEWHLLHKVTMLQYLRKLLQSTMFDQISNWICRMTTILASLI